MAAMTGRSFLMSRSCLVPINRATTRSSICATSILGFRRFLTVLACWPAPAVATAPVQTSYSIRLDAPAPRNTTGGPSREGKLRSDRGNGTSLGDDDTGGHGRDIAVGRDRAIREIAGKKAAELAPLVKIHIHDFESHVLGAVVAHDCGGLQVAHAD